MSLFGNSGNHIRGSHAASRKTGGKPAYRQPGETPLREEPRHEVRHSDELAHEFSDKVAENLGYTAKSSQKKHGKGLKIAGIVAGCVALLAVLCVVAYMIWSKPPAVETGGLKTQATVSPAPETSPSPGASATPSPSPSPTATATPVPARRENTYTVLVVGRDRVGMNTDTIMLVTMDCNAKKINVVSIPRDTLVHVDWSVKKVNSIYGALGTQGLLSGIENLVGFPIDNYVIINTYAFQEVIDAIGGVNFDVPINMYYDDNEQDLHIYINAGNQWLNGYQAEQVVRFRQNNDGTGYPNGDLGRIATQQQFVMSVAKQVLSLGNISNLPNIVDIILNNTDTDLSSGNIAFYAQEFLKMNSDSIVFNTMPYDSVSILGGSYVSIQLEPWLKMVNTYLNPFNTDVTEKNVDILMDSNGVFSSTTGKVPDISSFYDYTAAVG